MESKGVTMKPFKKCPVCGGELENKQVEKLLRVEGNTVAMKVTAEVCLHCGERLYAEDVGIMSLILSAGNYWNNAK